MKRVLIPTDFSSNAKKAAEYAIMVFGDEAEITLVHAYQIPHSGATVLISVQDIIEKDSKKMLEEERVRLSEKHPSLRSRIAIESRLGEPQEVLRKLINEAGADMVVMGTQGATGLKGILVGSVAASVMERVNVPVLAIPAEAEINDPINIAFAADDQSLNELKLPEIVREMAVKYASEVHVINVVGKEEARSVGMSGSAESEPITTLKGVKQTYHFLEDKDVTHGLDEYLGKHNVDLLALVNRKQDLFSMLFNRSVTKSMMLHSKTPILAIPQL